MKICPFYDNLTLSWKSVAELLQKNDWKLKHSLGHGI